MKHDKMTPDSVNDTALPDDKTQPDLRVVAKVPARVDRLPTSDTDRDGKKHDRAFHTPHPRDPYFTRRGEESRAAALALVGLDSVSASVTLLNRGGFGPAQTAYPGVFEHNVYCHAAARYYAGFGLRVVDSHALHTHGEPTAKGKLTIKNPRGAGWQNEATTDPAKIDARWTGDGEYPPNKKGEVYDYASARQPRNVSIVTGQGIVCFDLDPPQGEDSLAQLEAEYGKLPATVEQITGSGGRQMIFRVPVDCDVRNTVSAVAPNIDIRGHNGQMMVAPSLHPSGNYYRWKDGCAPGQIEIADAPDWLVKLMLDASKVTGIGTAKPRAAKKSASRSNSQAATDSPLNASGFDAKLGLIGDGEDYGGFNSPIYRAMCAWFAEHGSDSPADAVGQMKEQVREAVRAAPCKTGRNVEERYTTDAYLDDEVSGARTFIAACEKEDDEDGEAAPVTDAPDDPGADAGNPFVVAGDTVESASAETSDVIEDGAESLYENPKVWLPKRYKIAGNAIAVLGDKDADCKREKIPVCQVFNVVGRSSNEDGTAGAGRIIAFENENGKQVELTISRADIAADGKAVVRELADAGLLISGRGTRATDRLLDLLNEITPQRQIPTVTAPGWVRNEHGDTRGFMHPTGLYDRVSADGAIYRLLEGSRVETIKPRGSLEGWKGAAVESLSYADSNFYWPLGLAAGFSGPILGILNWLPCGFSLSGKTSRGKTVAQILGSSVWSSPMPGKGVLFTANTTGNAMEDLSVRGTDTFLALDEVGAMSDKRALSGILFALSTGRTKSRKSGRGRGLSEGDSFRPFTVLSSEKGMRAEIQAAGDSYRAGLSVRFPDVDVSDGVAVDDVALKKLNAVNLNYGHAGPIFIQYLIANGIAQDAAKLEREVLKIAADLAANDSPATKRAARVFAVAQRAGEIAADADLLGDVTKAKTAIRVAVANAWVVYSDSDEAKGASSGEGLLDVIAARLHGMWDRTVIEAGSKDGGGEASAENARGTPFGWYDETHVYLDWAQLADPVKVLGVEITRAELVKTLGDAVERKSDREAPQSKLPAHVAKAAGGDGRAVRNLKLDRAKLGL